MSKQNNDGGQKSDGQQGQQGKQSKPTQQNHNTGGGAPAKSANVVSLGGCTAEGCKKKPEKAGFCMEHFDWFKEGLITKEGRKPSDFEKKHFNYMQRRKPAA